MVVLLVPHRDLRYTLLISRPGRNNQLNILGKIGDREKGKLIT